MAVSGIETLQSSDKVSSTQHTSLKYVRLGFNGLSGLLHLVVEDVVVVLSGPYASVACIFRGSSRCRDHIWVKCLSGLPSVDILGAVMTSALSR